MNLASISLKNLLSKPLSSLLSLLLLVLGVAMISFMMVVNHNLENDFRKNIKDIDLVVGAKGSPLQLILSAVYQIDNPTGNVNYADVSKSLRNPLVEKTIPLAYGDSYNGYRIVGTDYRYPENYGIQVADGRLWGGHFECTIGSKVARDAGLKIGDTFFSQHGLVDDTHVHDDMAFKVIGIFEESGTVIDRLILTTIESLWYLHDDQDHSHDDEGDDGHAHDHHDHDHDHGDHDRDHSHTSKADYKAPLPGDVDPDREVTAVLVQFKSSMGLMTLPNMINKNTKFQTALPAIEINRLFELFGAGIAALRLIALAIIIISALSMFISLFNSLKERKYEMALMRSMGASPGKLFVMILIEANLLALGGILVGYIVSRLGLIIATGYADEQMGANLLTVYPLAGEYLLYLLVIGVANLAAIIPAFQVIRLNISEILTKK